MDKDFLDYASSHGLKGFLAGVGYEFDKLSFSNYEGDGWGYNQFHATEVGENPFIICAEEDNGMVFTINKIEDQ